MFGLFNDESASWAEEEAVEAGFLTAEEAEEANQTRYSPDDELVVHEIEIEEPEEEDETEDGEEDDEA